MNHYHLAIVTPAGKIFDGDVDYLSAPGKEGNFGILAHHTAIIAQIKKGLLKVVQDKNETFFSVADGVLEVDHKGNVVILASAAQQTSAESVEKK